ncbi:MAG TPA: hypothetical protein VFI66_06165 [Gemmatimonadales bacterium]|nr:hypothetical protein [Gemmatimonadales bacterium]
MTRGAAVLVLAGIVLVASAHVGSPDTYFEGSAGPYPVRVVIRTPGVVPGLAQITVRLLAPRAVRRVLVLPVYWDPRTAAPPPPDVAERVPGDSTLYGAALWLMSGGSYSVRVTVEGENGTGAVLVPVMAIATRRLALDAPLGVALLALGAFLFLGALTLVGAAVKESGLEPGALPDRRRTLRSRIAMTLTAVILALGLVGGRAWWNAVDAAYRTGLYEPLHAMATVRARGPGRVLRLAIDDTSWTNPKHQWTPLVPDHGHLMHLFLAHDSSLDAFAHLHPLPLDSATFETALPPLPPGRYRLYADIVHESGFTQTLVSTVEIAATAGAWQPSDRDDAWLATRDAGRVAGVVSRLADGSTMTWERGAAPTVVDEDASLRFAVTDPQGRPAALEPYMGMAGHAMLTRDDGAVFVHLHPAGTVSLAALETFALRQPGDTVRGLLGARLTAFEKGSQERGAVPTGPLLHQMERLSAPGSVSFPYAFPKAGRYRIWVQVKRGGRILTGVFDADVRPTR